MSHGDVDVTVIVIVSQVIRVRHKDEFTGKIECVPWLATHAPLGNRLWLRNVKLLSAIHSHRKWTYLKFDRLQFRI